MNENEIFDELISLRNRIDEMIKTLIIHINKEVLKKNRKV